LSNLFYGLGAAGIAVGSVSTVATFIALLFCAFTVYGAVPYILIGCGIFILIHIGLIIMGFNLGSYYSKKKTKIRLHSVR
jgi:hypothetical protein